MTKSTVVSPNCGDSALHLRAAGLHSITRAGSNSAAGSEPTQRTVAYLVRRAARHLV